MPERVGDADRRRPDAAASAGQVLRYRLAGHFIESCNCKLICPCWIDDEPDEDFCAGLFAWTFDAGSMIENHDVGGRHVVSVTVHGDARRGGDSQSAIYVDDRLPTGAIALLIRAFSGQGGGPLSQIARVTGDVVDSGAAQVWVANEPDGWSVAVHVEDCDLVTVAGRPARFDGRATPLQLQNTALATELGTAAEAVEASRADRLTIDIAALPGRPLDLVGRSGMRGRFRYLSTDVGDGDDRPGGRVPGGSGDAP